MLTKLHHQLQRTATPRHLFALLVVFVGLNSILMFSPYSPITTLQNDAGNVQLLDMAFNYTPDNAYQILTAYGENGRNYYLSVFLRIDLFAPVLVALFLAMATSVVFQHAFAPDHPVQKLSLLPFAAMMADYLENIGIFFLIMMFPARLDWLAVLTNYFTVAKFMLTFGILILLLISVVKLIWNRLQKNRVHP